MHSPVALKNIDIAVFVVARYLLKKEWTKSSSTEAGRGKISKNIIVLFSDFNSRTKW